MATQTRTAEQTQKLKGWWEGVYWYGENSCGFQEQGLYAALDFWWDLDLEEDDRATAEKIDRALETGEIEFGDDEMGIKLTFVEVAE